MHNETYTVVAIDKKLAKLAKQKVVSKTASEAITAHSSGFMHQGKLDRIYNFIISKSQRQKNRQTFYTPGIIPKSRKQHRPLGIFRQALLH